MMLEFLGSCKRNRFKVFFCFVLDCSSTGLHVPLSDGGIGWYRVFVLSLQVVYHDAKMPLATDASGCVFQFPSLALKVLTTEPLVGCAQKDNGWLVRTPLCSRRFSSTPPYRNTTCYHSPTIARQPPLFNRLSQLRHAHTPNRLPRRAQPKHSGGIPACAQLHARRGGGEDGTPIQARLLTFGKRWQRGCRGYGGCGGGGGV